ncbi:MAG: hypothetical protein M3376_13955 [Actinomycetota bacterium]|nr:hypothetical protein [Actinomycetota bacterium]
MLRSFASTRLAAAGVLALASAQPARHLRALNLDGLSEDASAVSLRGRVYPIPFGHRPNNPTAKR